MSASTPSHEHSMGSNHVDFAGLSLRALEHLPALMKDTLGLDIKEVSDGNEMQFLNPHRVDDDFGSASINALTGKWADFAEDDEAKGGDVISFVAYVKEVGQLVAARLLTKALDAIDDASGTNEAKTTKPKHTTGNSELIVAVDDQLAALGDQSSSHCQAEEEGLEDHAAVSDDIRRSEAATCGTGGHHE